MEQNRPQGHKKLVIILCCIAILIIVLVSSYFIIRNKTQYYHSYRWGDSYEKLLGSIDKDNLISEDGTFIVYHEDYDENKDSFYTLVQLKFDRDKKLKTIGVSYEMNPNVCDTETVSKQYDLTKTKLDILYHNGEKARGITGYQYTASKSRIYLYTMGATTFMIDYFQQEEDSD